MAEVAEQRRQSRRNAGDEILRHERHVEHDSAIAARRGRGELGREPLQRRTASTSLGNRLAEITAPVVSAGQQLTGAGPQRGVLERVIREQRARDLDHLPLLADFEQRAGEVEQDARRLESIGGARPEIQGRLTLAILVKREAEQAVDRTRLCMVDGEVTQQVDRRLALVLLEPQPRAVVQ